MEQSKQHFTPWEVSATGYYNERELAFLRDTHPDEIAEVLVKLDSEVKIITFYEYIVHGAVQKAALLARAMVRLDPETKGFLERHLSEDFAHALLEENVLNLGKYNITIHGLNV